MSKNQNTKNLFATNNTLFGNSDSFSLFTTTSPISDDKCDKQKWLNDVDSSLILENIDNTAKNRVVKIKLKIKTLEKTLDRVDEELKILQLFNLDKDKEKRAELSGLKENLKKQIYELKEEKKKFGVFYIISAYTNNKVTYENLKKYVDVALDCSSKYLNIGIEYIKNRTEFKSFFKR